MAVVNLQKGENVSLSKDGNLEHVKIGLGWNPRDTHGDDFDLDASAFLLNSGNKVRRDEDFIFYNNRESVCKSVRHMGDDRTGGSSDGDDEEIHIELRKVPSEVQKITFTVTIYEAEKRRQNFGMVSGSFIRLVNNKTDVEIARFDLNEDASIETAMIFGELYRHNNEWRFRAVGQGFKGGLREMCLRYGVNVG